MSMSLNGSKHMYIDTAREHMLYMLYMYNIIRLHLFMCTGVYSRQLQYVFKIESSMLIIVAIVNIR
jgi:hypothetical protein